MCFCSGAFLNEFRNLDSDALCFSCAIELDLSFFHCFFQERENPTLTEWDRFAHREYIRLSMEEDGEDASIGSGDVWDETVEAPF